MPNSMPFLNSIESPPLELLSHPLFLRHGVSVGVLRLDLIHPTIHGNKWFKLKRNLADLRARDRRRVLSFGGAYSNHLYALAAAGKAFGFETIGVIRGEIVEPLNPILAFASEQGMQLIPLSRADYRLKESAEIIARLRARFGDVDIIPEGGSNLLAVEGCAEIVDSLDWSLFDKSADQMGIESLNRVVAVSCGTATTLAGLVHGLESCGEASSLTPQVYGVAVLRARDYLKSEAAKWLSLAGAEACSGGASPKERVRWMIDERYHFGGYARKSAELTTFTHQFESITGLPLEPVYTGKLFFALCDRISNGEFVPGTQIIALHTGGVVR